MGYKRRRFAQTSAGLLGRNEFIVNNSSEQNGAVGLAGFLESKANAKGIAANLLKKLGALLSAEAILRQGVS